MTKKSRTILFYSCVFLFLLIAPISVLYSQGYRFDFSTRQVVKTGALFVKTAPKQADIYVDGKLKARTNFFSGSALISNLVPEKYSVKVEKDGYFTWEKNLTVIQKQVTEVKSLILFPQNPGFSSLATGVEKYWPTPDGREIILYENSSSTQSQWNLEIYNLSANTKTILASSSDFGQKNAELINLAFSTTTPNAVNLDIGTQKNSKTFILNYAASPATISTTTVASSTASTTPKNVVAFQKYGNSIYYLDSSGDFFMADYNFNPQLKLDKISFPIKKTASYKVRIFQNFIFLQENNNLYLFNQNTKAFENFFSSVKDMKVSPDGKKLLIYSNSEILVLYIQDTDDQPQKKAGDSTLIFRSQNEIENVSWLNSSYLVFNAGNQIEISEIDDRDKINIFDIAKFQNPQMFFNPVDGKIYVLSQGNLESSQNLLP